MNPILVATLRRHWPLVGAVGLFATFTLAHQFVFQPAARRYEASVKRASELGLVLDPTRASAMMPPRVFALVADNALPSAEALELGNSGVLTARLLEDLSRILGERGLEVMATQPGPVSQQSRSVTVRANLRLRGRYAEVVSMFDALAQSGRLISVDRFTMNPEGAGQMQIDLWVSRLILKQERRAR